MHLAFVRKSGQNDITHFAPCISVSDGIQNVPRSSSFKI